jgi:LPXTG-site transpeptidase (sortase) family protein
MIKKIIKLSIILIISAIIGNTIYGIYKESIISDTPNKTAIINENNTELIKNNVNSNEKNKNVIKEKIAKEYKGYVVSAKLEIPKIKLDTYVLDEKSEEAMWVCPTKYYGPEPNEVGNYCIAAHNYDKENMFNHIIDLKIGDKIYLTDNENGKIEYRVYDIYKTEPENTMPLMQATEKTEITLITCSDYSSKRIIVKAIK